MGTKMDARQYIRIRGANENNLKNIDVDLSLIHIFGYNCQIASDRAMTDNRHNDTPVRS